MRDMHETVADNQADHVETNEGVGQEDGEHQEHQTEEEGNEEIIAASI